MDVAQAVAALQVLGEQYKTDPKFNREDLHLAADGVLLTYLEANEAASVAQEYDRLRDEHSFWYS